MGYRLGGMETAEVKERHGSFPAWRCQVCVKSEKVVSIMMSEFEWRRHQYKLGGGIQVYAVFMGVFLWEGGILMGLYIQDICLQ